MEMWNHTAIQYLRKWEQYCSTRKVDPISATVIDGVNFLNELYQKELSYSVINTARAALSAVIHPPGGCTFGHHPMVARFLKGVFTARPTLPRYQEVWDVSVVLKYLKTLHPPEQLSLKDLTLKMTMLIALLSAKDAKLFMLWTLPQWFCQLKSVYFIFMNC